jgi:hypothetical protein
MRRRVLLPLAFALCASRAAAIEAPASSQPPAEQPASQTPNIVPNDETAFVEVLQRSSHHRNLTGLKISTDVVALLARGDVAGAIATLSRQAAGGNNDANIALVRIQHWCNRIATARAPDARAQIAKLPSTLDPERAARAAGVLIAEEKYRQVASRSCAQAQFDYNGIEARLRQAADAGDPASATELAQFTRDPARKQAMLEAAADKGFAPAQYVLATSRLIAVQRGATTENVASIRLLLKQAGRSINKAKVDLANCMALGCDGHPAVACRIRLRHGCGTRRRTGCLLIDGAHALGHADESGGLACVATVRRSLERSRLRRRELRDVDDHVRSNAQSARAEHGHRNFGEGRRTSRRAMARSWTASDARAGMFGAANGLTAGATS